MDLTPWVKTPRVDIDFKENYGTKLLCAPNQGRAWFWLEPKQLRNPHGEDQPVQFKAHYRNGCMLHNWAELLFTPLGTVPVPPLAQKLPPWSPDKEPDYAAALDPLIAELYRDGTQMERLEAYLPLFLDQSDNSQRQATIDRVRMAYLQNAVDADNPNLVLIVFSYHAGYQIRQNGAGSGPPREF